MRVFFMVIIAIMMLCTAGVLTAGLIGMARQTDPRRSNKLMQWRVVLQGATILLFAIFMLLLRC